MENNSSTLPMPLIEWQPKDRVRIFLKFNSWSFTSLEIIIESG